MRTGHPIANTWRLRCVTRRARETRERHRVYCIHIDVGERGSIMDMEVLAAASVGARGLGRRRPGVFRL